MDNIDPIIANNIQIVDREIEELPRNNNWGAFFAMFDPQFRAAYKKFGKHKKLFGGSDPSVRSAINKRYRQKAAKEKARRSLLRREAMRRNKIQREEKRKAREEKEAEKLRRLQSERQDNQISAEDQIKALYCNLAKDLTN